MRVARTYSIVDGAPITSGDLLRNNQDRPMPHDPTTWIATELAELDAQGLRRTLCERQLGQGAVIRVDGHELVNFGSNDYLGLASHQCHAAVCTAIDSVGWGAGASPLVVGRGSEHAALERELADFEGTEAALLFSSGYAANVGAIAALAGRSDAVFSDAKNHASIIDGARLSKAATVVYRHNDLEDLERVLCENRGAGRVLVVTESVFSMDGDLAPLADISKACRLHGAWLMVDEAHGAGVFGKRGAGLVQELGLEGEVQVHMGTLGKAVGSAGGYLAADRRWIDLLLNSARSFIYSTAPPPAQAAASLRGLEIIASQRGATLRDRLWRNINNFGELSSQEPVSAIVSVMVGQNEPAVQAAEALLQAGFLAPAIRFPTVPRGTARLRITLSAAHETGQIEELHRELRKLAIVN